MLAALLMPQPFLSTPSARRATITSTTKQRLLDLISIHALREEGDESPCVAFCVFRIFLSTPSARRATHFCFGSSHCVVISIHALREEGDAGDRGAGRLKCNFYPRPPRGGRPDHFLWCAEFRNFYPRPPRGGRLLCKLCKISDHAISIHALREEGDGGKFGSEYGNDISIHALREEGDTGPSTYWM